MKGFKDFLLRGNLIELAVAFIMGGAFATVVTTFTKIILDLLGKIGGQPNFDNLTMLGGVNIGKFITALVSFVIIAATVYFFIVKPYEAARERFKKSDEEVAPASSEELLTEIRDLLQGRNGGTTVVERDVL